MMKGDKMKFQDKFNIFVEKYKKFWGENSIHTISLSNETFEELNELIDCSPYDNSDSELKKLLIEKLAEISLTILTYKNIFGDKEIEKEMEKLMKNELELIDSLNENKNSNEEQENEQI